MTLESPLFGKFSCAFFAFFYRKSGQMPASQPAPGALVAKRAGDDRGPEVY